MPVRELLSKASERDIKLDFQIIRMVPIQTMNKRIQFNLKDWRAELDKRNDRLFILNDSFGLLALLLSLFIHASIIAGVAITPSAQIPAQITEEIDIELVNLNLDKELPAEIQTPPLVNTVEIERPVEAQKIEPVQPPEVILPQASVIEQPTLAEDASKPLPLDTVDQSKEEPKQVDQTPVASVPLDTIIPKATIQSPLLDINPTVASEAISKDQSIDNRKPDYLMKPLEKPEPSQSAVIKETAKPTTKKTDVVSSVVKKNTVVSATSEVSEYQKNVVDRIKSVVRYPEDARDDAPQGIAIVRFTISGKGELLSVSIDKSAGNALLDAAALAAVKRAGPYSIPPSGLSETFTAPLSFKIK